ncbi:MAG: hypothetical protein ABR571_10105 [Jatrophihabitans sp.]|uniref:hypothetical protein n=1 Tax=Jatrophihabitans sp. TaxID=1932789 RepID=UPI00390FAF6B
MRRSIKLAGITVACVAVGSLATGLAVANTTTSPLTFCVAKTGAVTYPGASTCAKGQTPVQVASPTDVAALASRVDAIEGKQTSDETAISNLQAANQSLSSQLQTAQTTISDQGTKIDSLSVRLQSLEDYVLLPATLTASLRTASDYAGEFYVTVVGARLKPGSAVVVHFSFGDYHTVGWANSDGTFSNDYTVLFCGDSLYFTGTDHFGNTVTSDTYTPPPAGC